MRLMLGHSGFPELLVDTDKDYCAKEFKFYVVNGGWEGKFYNGNIVVHGAPSGGVTYIDNIEILCSNQDRLRGDYWCVFENFSNVDYVAPTKKEFIMPEEWDDDIPF